MTAIQVRSPFLSAYRDGDETRHEAADYLKCSYRTLKRYVEQRRIPVRKLAGTNALHFYRLELDAWLDGAELEIVCDDATRGLIVKLKGAGNG